MFREVLTIVILGLVAADPFPISAIVGRSNPLSPHGGRIVGGKPTTIEEYPWQVSLQILGFHFCGGSIISESFVLTAAHCTSYPVGWISARVGSATLHAGGSVHRVKEIVRHPEYRANSNGIPVNDIALLKLRSPVALDDRAKPVALFDKDEEAAEGTVSSISGWGKLAEGGSMPEVLHSVDVPIVSKAECDEAYKQDFDGVPPKQICAAYPEGGKDTCQGDSGGPLVVAGRQAGIVSWGNGCARKGYPGVYTEVAAFRDWLAQNAGVL